MSSLENFGVEIAIGWVKDIDEEVAEDEATDVPPERLGERVTEGERSISAFNAVPLPTLDFDADVDGAAAPLAGVFGARTEDVDGLLNILDNPCFSFLISFLVERFLFWDKMLWREERHLDSDEATG